MKKISAQQQDAPNTFVDDEVIDLRKIWVVLLRNKWGIILVPLLAAMLAYLYVSTLTPIYRATSTLLIQPPSSNIVGIQGVESITGNNEFLQTQFELLKSRQLAELVVKELNFVADVIPSENDEATADDRLERAISSFRRTISISPRQNTQIVDMSVEMADPETAARAATVLARGYIDLQIQGRLEVTTQATNWMSRRLSELEDELKASERRLQDYVEQEDLVDMGGITTVEAAELSQINDRLIDARQAFARAENEYRQIADYTADEWRMQATAPAVRSNSLIAEFIGAEVRARARVDELSQRYGPQHPRMIEAQDELTAATESLRGQVRQVAASIEQAYRLSESNLASLQAAFNANREDIRDVQAKATQFRQLEREVESNRALYDRFLTRLNETSATADIEEVNARIIDAAIVPKSPVKPRVMRSAGITGILALMAVIGLAFLREQLDNRIRSSSDVDEKLRVPMLGLTPLQKKASRSEIARLYLSETKRTFSEAIRTIRTGVVLSGLDNPHKRILITSSVPGEGKTSLACNLASALGQLERVILIEADMRNPTLKHVYGMDKNQPGLADVLAQNATLEQSVHHVDDIAVLACGTLPPDPLELLSSNRFNDLLGQLNQEYDRIVIDAPPVHAVTDPLVLASCANAVLYVVKSDATAAPMVLKGLSRFDEFDAPVLGVVLSHFDANKSGQYGYGYKYANDGYYDYYGYSSNKKA